jgi:hypothetical protein
MLPIDITGQRFGRLVAIERVENRAGRPFCRFACDCGKDHTVRLSHVKQGLIKSCGCIMRGEIFGLGDLSELTAEKLRKVLSYNPDTGEFRWLVASINKRAKIGERAGVKSTKSGTWLREMAKGAWYRESLQIQATGAARIRPC